MRPEAEQAIRRSDLANEIVQEVRDAERRVAGLLETKEIRNCAVAVLARWAKTRGLELPGVPDGD